VNERRRWRFGRRRRLRGKGTAAIELALIAPMLLILFAGVIDFGRAFHDEIALSGAVAAAADYALLNASSVNSTSAGSLAATLSGIVANANGAAWANATVTVNDGATSTVTGGSTTSSGTAANANLCFCPTGTAGGPIWGSAGTCGTSCTGGTLAGKFVTISGTRQFSAIFTTYGWVNNRSLHQSTIVQVQ
jgi:Flp pilus assembly protein TadG